MEINPYSAPTADLCLTATANDPISKNFRRFSAWWVFLLSIVTLRIYPIFWIINHAQILNRIQPKPLAPIWLYLMAISLASSFVMEYRFPEMVWTLGAINIIYLVTLLTSLFKVKNRLKDLMTESAGTPYPLSPILTFLFDVIYLQYKINQFIDDRQTSIAK
ncbi:DUF4234 domain-containing protein [Microbulbifer pacificus]|uniref:DUF4234 domain-containing protein n=1 Tax=Microbulbifer pacificus TaxID=407164 RepID=A0AAU0MZS8_9GAMM|nr:DUF4234 domain-containing protein [Microbulbifer pacificus]WOX05518.1 DUF4234 domain-containing protein [Microbulbifer pacificus]